jgi:hypothetical protein
MRNSNAMSLPCPYHWRYFDLASAGPEPSAPCAASAELREIHLGACDACTIEDGRAVGVAVRHAQLQFTAAQFYTHKMSTLSDGTVMG